MAARKPRTAAKSRAQSKARPRAATKAGAQPKAKPRARAKAAATGETSRFARARAWLIPSGRPGRFVLAIVGILALLIVALVTISIATPEQASTVEELPPPNPFDARASSRDALTVQRLAASCGLYGELTDAHGVALDLPTDESILALARLEAAVPSEGSTPLDQAFAHLRSALQLDVEAGAFTAADDHERALAAYRAAEAESLQAEAYAAAACEG